MSDGTGHLLAPARKLPVLARPDVLVVGGGAAGVMAACAAARAGASVLLAERAGFLGGTMTSVTLGGLCGAFVHTRGQIRPIVGGLYSELIERLEHRRAVSAPRIHGFVHGVPYDPEALRGVLDEIVLEAGVRLLLHAHVSEVVREGRRVDWVEVETSSGRAAIRPKVVVDCSGDAEVVFRGRGSFSLGDGGRTQHASSMFRMSGVDAEAFFSVPRHAIDAILLAAVLEGERLSRTSVAVYPSPVEGVAHLNATRVQREDGEPFDLTDPWQFAQAEVEGRRQAALYARVANERLPGFSKARIVALGASLGVRETRLIAGDRTLSGDDVLHGVKPEDRIACSAWPIEDHATGGKTIWKPLADGDWYGIPFGCLVSRDFDNVLVAGRCLSATHAAQASARVAATCMAMGEAAGMASSMALKADGRVRVDVLDLQSRLRRAGAILEL